MDRVRFLSLAFNAAICVGGPSRHSLRVESGGTRRPQ
jgi:hypothetical protein